MNEFTYISLTEEKHKRLLREAEKARLEGKLKGDRGRNRLLLWLGRIFKSNRPTGAVTSCCSISDTKYAMKN